MSLIEDILLQAKQHNIVLYVKEDKLAYVAEQGGFPAELKQLVGQHKEAIVAYLQTTPDASNVKPFSLLEEDLVHAYREHCVDAYPLTALQAGMVFHSQLSDFDGVYHDFATERLKCPWHQQHFETALNHCIESHPILRTGYDFTTEQQIQFVRKTLDLPLQITDIRSLNQSQQEAQMADWMEQRKKFVFDWSRLALWQVNIFLLTDDCFEFVISFHHSVLDGWSRTVLTKELYTHYLQLMQGGILPAATPEWIFRDVVALEQQAIKNDAAKEYFNSMLDGVLPDQIPQLAHTDNSYHTAPYIVHRGEQFLSRSGALFSLSKRLGVPIQAILLAAHFKVLSTVSGRNKVVTCITTNCRPAQEGGDSGIGLFLNSLPMAVAFEQMSWAELISHIDSLIRNNYLQRYYPLAVISQQTMMEFSEVLFNYTHFHGLKDVVDGSLSNSDQGAQLLKQSTFEQTNFKFAVDFSRAVIGEGMDLSIRYDSNLYDELMITQIYQYYINTCDQILADIDSNCYQCCVLSPQERTYLLSEFNQTEVSFCQQTLLHDLFVEQAQKTPEHHAIVFGQQQISYRELDQRSNQLAHHLQSLKVGVESLVGVAMERSVEMVVSLLAILKAGGAYVPIDPELPAARIEYLLGDSEVACLLTHTKFVALFADYSGYLVDVDTLTESLKICADILPDIHQVSSKNAAYMIYTSGSTGKPKGVLLDHLAIRNRIDWMQRQYQLSSDDKVLQKTPFSFDVSVWEFFWPLSYGATLVVAKPQGHKDPHYLDQLIRSEAVSILHFVPSMLDAYLQTQSFAPSVRYLFCSGEALSLALAKRVVNEAADLELHNLYGPTEAAVDVSHFDCRDLTLQKTVPIGRPIQNTQLLVLNQQGNLCPVGTVGELHIGGVGLARHYHRQPTLTAEKFITTDTAKQASEAWPSRLYQTGDLVRLSRAGQLEYIGRTDFQVKIRGFRVELGEIEFAISQHAKVVKCIVGVYHRDAGDEHLVAYIQLQPEQMQDEVFNQVKQNLTEQLPAHMIPAFFVAIEHWPLTANGKIDQRALPSPQGALVSHSYVEPVTPTEAALVKICSDLLKIDEQNISAVANFFDLGGHSLLLLRFKAQLKQTFNVDVSINTMFELLKLNELAAHIDDALLRSSVAVGEDYQLEDDEMDIIL